MRKMSAPASLQTTALLPEEERVDVRDDLRTMDLLGPLPRIMGAVPIHHNAPVALSRVITAIGAVCVFGTIGYTVWEGVVFGFRDSLMVEIVLLATPIASFFFAHTYLRWDHFACLVESSRDLPSSNYVSAKRSFRLMQTFLLSFLLLGLLAVEIVSAFYDAARKPPALFALRTIGWAYIFVSIVFFVSLFDFVCTLQVQQIVSYSQLLRDEGTSIITLCEEFFRLREQLSRTSHHFRRFISMMLLTTTVGALLGLYVFFEHGVDMTQRTSILVLICVEALFQVSMSILIVRAGAKVTHLCEKVPGMVATMRTACSVSMLVTSVSNVSYSLRRSVDTPMNPMTVPGQSSAGLSTNIQSPASPGPWKDGSLRAKNLDILYGCIIANPMGIRLYGISVNRDTLLKVSSLYLALTLFLTQRIMTNAAMLHTNPQT